MIPKDIYATVGCCQKACMKTYHLPCGVKYGALNEYYGNFDSYCPTHRAKRTPKSNSKKNYVLTDLGLVPEHVDIEAGYDVKKYRAMLQKLEDESGEGSQEKESRSSRRAKSKSDIYVSAQDELKKLLEKKRKLREDDSDSSGDEREQLVKTTNKPGPKSKTFASKQKNTQKKPPIETIPCVENPPNAKVLKQRNKLKQTNPSKKDEIKKQELSKESRKDRKTRPKQDVKISSPEKEKHDISGASDDSTVDGNFVPADSESEDDEVKEEEERLVASMTRRGPAGPRRPRRDRRQATPANIYSSAQDELKRLLEKKQQINLDETFTDLVGKRRKRASMQEEDLEGDDEPVTESVGKSISRSSKKSAKKAVRALDDEEDSELTLADRKKKKTPKKSKPTDDYESVDEESEGPVLDKRKKKTTMKAKKTTENESIESIQKFLNSSDKKTKWSKKDRAINSDSADDLIYSPSPEKERLDLSQEDPLRMSEEEGQKSKDRGHWATFSDSEDEQPVRNDGLIDASALFDDLVSNDSPLNKPKEKNRTNDESLESEMDLSDMMSTLDEENQTAEAIRLAILTRYKCSLCARHSNSSETMEEHLLDAHGASNRNIVKRQEMMLYLDINEARVKSGQVGSDTSSEHSINSILGIPNKEKIKEKSPKKHIRKSKKRGVTFQDQTDHLKGLFTQLQDEKASSSDKMDNYEKWMELGKTSTPEQERKCNSPLENKKQVAAESPGRLGGLPSPESGAMFECLKCGTKIMQTQDLVTNHISRHKLSLQQYLGKLKIII